MTRTAYRPPEILIEDGYQRIVRTFSGGKDLLFIEQKQYDAMGQEAWVCRSFDCFHADDIVTKLINKLAEGQK